jgi:hypothetical protein
MTLEAGSTAAPITLLGARAEAIASWSPWRRSAMVF